MDINLLKEANELLDRRFSFMELIKGFEKDSGIIVGPGLRKYWEENKLIDNKNE